MFGMKKSTPATANVRVESRPLTNGGAAAGGNRAATKPADTLSVAEAQRRTAAVARVSVAFAQVVSVLMRSSLHKHFSLADLEWLVVPPLIAGQCRVAEAKSQPDGPGVPVAAVLWASVSPEVDRRLSENLNAPIRLRPDEWKSGDILWLVEAVGDGRVLPPLLKQLSENTFKGRSVKMRTRGEGGKLAVRPLTEVLKADQEKGCG